MHDLTDILSSCFDKLYKIENVIRVDEIPGIITDYYKECWKITTELEVCNRVEQIELYFGFQDAFPYVLPEVYFPDKRFGYIPHIESLVGKICLMTDGVSYLIDNPYGIIHYCLKQSKILIEQGLNGKNIADYDAEINSYWVQTYGGEPAVSYHWLIHGDFPDKTCVFKALIYKQNILGANNNESIIKGLLLPQDNEQTDIECYLKKHYRVDETNALYVKSITVPHKAPYSLSLQGLLDCTLSADDRKAIKQYVNTNRGGIIVFQLSEFSIGGICISKVNTTKKGFRHNSLTASDILLRFEKKNQLQKRLYGNLYSFHRIAMRTAGIEMSEQSFVIAGLGSVGSNLTYFLNSWNNVSFTLIDDESFRVENIGRHLLGYQYIDQSKVNAVADYLRSIRPERSVSTWCQTIQRVLEFNNERINVGTALFLCTGDAMTEKYVVDAIRDRRITLPTFILWLEPFGIAGHLVYINPERMPENFTLYSDENNMLYKYNLLAPIEYMSHADRFIKKDAGCNGEYTLYSGNDVTLMLSALFPYINQLIQQPEQSKCYRWVGNINIAQEKGLTLTIGTSLPIGGSIEELPF